MVDGEFDSIRKRLDADCERGGFVECAAAADLDPHYVVADHVDSQVLSVQPSDETVLGALYRVDPFEPDVVAGVDHARGVFQNAVEVGCAN